MTRAGGTEDAATFAARLEQRPTGLERIEIERLARFLGELVKWNRVHNLTGRLGIDELIDRHVVESLALRDELVGERIGDVGTGAGLPGIPLAIAEPARRFTLIESRAKRVQFLRHIKGLLGLSHVDIAHRRAEDLPTGSAFDTLLARAVAPPGEVLEIARQLTAPGGRVLVLTSAAHGEAYKTLACESFNNRRVRHDERIASVIVVLDRAAY